MNSGSIQFNSSGVSETKGRRSRWEGVKHVDFLLLFSLSLRKKRESQSKSHVHCSGLRSKSLK